MKTIALNSIRKKGSMICMFFLFLFAMEAFAQYGTSRRVARRTSRRTASRHDAYYGGGAAAGPGYITTLPGGCVLRAITGINYQYCNGVYYQPHYQGTTVVYQEAHPE